MSIFSKKSNNQCPANCSTNECRLILELRSLIAQERALSRKFDDYGMSFWLSDNLPQDAVDLLNEMHKVSKREIEIEQILGIDKYQPSTTKA